MKDTFFVVWGDVDGDLRWFGLDDDDGCPFMFKTRSHAVEWAKATGSSRFVIVKYLLARPELPPLPPPKKRTPRPRRKKTAKTTRGHQES